MFVPNSYDVVLHEAKSDHHVVGSAWSLFSVLVAVGFCISAVAYLA